MHKNIKNALAKTHREKIWIFNGIVCGKIIKREHKVTLPPQNAQTFGHDRGRIFC